jgi:outer membrane protein assembly factor BamD
MDRAVDAKTRLEALHQPVPRPTRAAFENSKKEEASRQQAGMLSKGLGTFEKFPDVSRAARVGEPTMVDPEPVTATGVVKELTGSMGGGDSKLKVETVNGTVTPNQEAPRSPAPAVAAAGAPVAAAELKASVADPNELKPNVEPDQNTLPPLQQSNQIDSGIGATSAVSSSTTAKTEEMADISSSKKKKKRGLKKLNPF